MKFGKHSWPYMKSYDSKTITGHQYTHSIAVVLFVFPLRKNVSINTHTHKKKSCTLKDFIYLNDIFFYFFVLYLYHIRQQVTQDYLTINVRVDTCVLMSLVPQKSRLLYFPYTVLLLFLWLHYGCCYWRNCIHIPGKRRREQSNTTHLIRQTFPEIPSRNWLTQAKNIIRKHETYRKASPISLIYPPSIFNLP